MEKWGLKSVRRALTLMLVVVFAGCGDTRPPKISKASEKPIEVPTRQGYLNDFVGVLEPTTRQNIESDLRALNQKTGIDFVIVLSESADGYSLEDHSMEIARQWCLDCRRNGKGEILLNILIRDEQFRLNVSKPLLNRLPDDVVSELQRALESSFVQDRYADGLTELVSKIRTKIDN
jgi:uncharacterized protein